MNLAALVPGAKTTSAELGAALRHRTQQRGAQQLAQALGHTPKPGANPFGVVKPAVAPPPSWLLKSASVDVDRYEALLAKAKKGDILVMSPKIPPGGESVISKAFNAVSRRVQGDLTHSAMYAGDGNVIDFRLDYGIKKMPLSELAGDVDVALVRPKVDAKAKTRALTKIEKAMARQGEGGPHYSVPQLFKTLAARVAPVGSDSKRLDSEICSTLISKSFDRKLVRGKSRSAVVPSDFLSSPGTDHILTYRNPNRPDERA